MTARPAAVECGVRALFVNAEVGDGSARPAVEPSLAVLERVLSYKPLRLAVAFDVLDISLS